MEIRRLFDGLKRWFWLLILGGMIGGVIGYTTSRQQVPIYQASTRFGVMNVYNYNDTNYTYYRNDSMFMILQELLNSKTFTQEISDQLGIEVSSGQAQLILDEDSIFMNLTVTDQDPVKAAALANGILPILFDEIQDLESSRYVLAEENLQAQITESETKMSEAQAQISAISEQNIEDNLAQVEAEINSLQSQINQLESDIAAIDPLTASDEEKLQLASDQDQLDQLNPILDLYQQIYTNLVVLGQPFESSNTAGFSQLDQLTTQFNLYREIYLNSRESLERLRLERTQNASSVIQIEAASVPTRPINANTSTPIIVYASVGVLIAGGIAFLIEYLDDTIKTPEEVKELTGLPVLGYVPQFQVSGSSKDDANSQSVLFFASQPRSPVSESLRLLRTSLEFSAVDQPTAMIVVTSAEPAAGKSTISANLAISMAKSGKKTLLIDADLRHPSIHRFFDLGNRVGLSDLLRGKIELDHAIVDSELSPNLQILTSGALPPDPSELVASEKMGKLLEVFKKNFDIILMDTPPMLVSEPQILASRADGVLYIIQPGKSHSRHFVTQLKQLDQINARVLGVVFNRITRQHKSYYGGQPYGNYYAKGGQLYFEADAEKDILEQS